MTTANGSDKFYGSIPVFRGFGKLMDPTLYSPLPDDWTIGVADIVESTKAIAEARYKAVNMAGAAVIAAVTNALEARALRCRPTILSAPTMRWQRPPSGSGTISTW